MALGFRASWPNTYAYMAAQLGQPTSGCCSAAALTRRCRLGFSLAVIAGSAHLACQEPPTSTQNSAVPPPKLQAPGPRVPPPPPPPPGPLQVPNSGFPPEIDEVLKLKCRRCHTAPLANGAPFTLLTWEDTRKLRHNTPIWKAMGTAVKSGFMPYRIPLTPPVQRLSPAEKAVFLAWVDAEAPGETSGWAPPGAGGAAEPRSKTTPSR